MIKNKCPRFCEWHLNYRLELYYRTWDAVRDCLSRERVPGEPRSFRLTYPDKMHAVGSNVRRPGCAVVQYVVPEERHMFYFRTIKSIVPHAFSAGFPDKRTNSAFRYSYF